MRKILLTTRRRKRVESTLPPDSDGFEIIECEPALIANYVTYDDSLSRASSGSSPGLQSSGFWPQGR
jgi:hypothetical protein